MIELLSPAGSMESLKAAIHAGCDAVYLGGTLFGARAFANNFSNEELIEAINYAHLYGVRVYVTTNTLIYEHEVEHFLKYIEFLHKNNVDAIIIQDLGMLDLVHKTFPNLEIHASTQMHIHNLDGVLVAKKLGVKRVVLARETPVEVVSDIIDKTKMDVEIFAHGALCVSYSGQCLFSSLIGNRSGNRGSCVGSCRLPYEVVDENNKKLNAGDYPLSMKDLNTLEYVGKLIESGVASLKIEGRMKSPEYVYTVTKLYREAIDSYYKNKKVFINQELLNNLQKIFSRGYTKGYLFNENINNILNTKRPNHQGVKIGKVIDYQNGYVFVKLNDTVSINDGLRIVLKDFDYGVILNQFYINKKLVKIANKNDTISFKVNKKIPINSDVLLTKDDSLNKEINQIINNNPRKIPISIKLKAQIKERLHLILDDGKNKVEVFGNVLEKALNKETSKEEIKEKLIKLGNTIYTIKGIDIEIDSNIFIPLGEVNKLRQKAVELLNQKRLYQTNYLKSEYDIKLKDFYKEEKRAIFIEENNNIDISKYNIVYANNLDNAIKYIPRVVDNYDKYNINEEYLVGELGAFNKLNNIITDYSFNVTNSYTVALLHSLGAKRVTLSYELSDKQIENLINAYIKRYNKYPNLELVVYGHLEVMILKTDLNKIYNKKILYLKDRYNNLYKVIDKNGLSCMFDYKIRNIDNMKYYEMGINCLRIKE